MKTKNLKTLAAIAISSLFAAIPSFVLVMVILFNAAEIQERKLRINELISVNIVMLSILLILGYSTNLIIKKTLNKIDKQ